MFSQADVADFEGMDWYANRYSKKSESCSVNQNSAMAKTTVWSYASQNQSLIESSNNFSQNNISFNKFNSTNSHNSSGTTGITDSWRKDASIEDWEAYLYSPTTDPVKNVTQMPASTATNAVVSNVTKYVTPRATHRAHISFVSTPNGVFKPIVKRKRKRTTFTTEQVEALEAIFYKRPYVSREERQNLMEHLQLSDKAIKVWFQNRRLKVKKEREEQELESSDSETIFVQDAEPLAYVEAQMCNADKFGYVTLDDRAMNDLVNVIDNFLPKDADLGNTDSDKSEPENRLYSVSESESSAIYEPISPPDLSDGASQDGLNQKWEMFEAIEPKKSLQNLFDVHMYDCKC